MARSGLYKSSVAPKRAFTPCVYLVRHGETDYNTGEERFRAHANVPLNENGRARAEEIAQEFADENLLKIYTSDLSRAADTAQAIHDANGAPIVETSDLRPWDLGELTGKPVKTHLATMKMYLNSPGTKIPGGESFNAFKRRFIEAFKRYLAQAVVNADYGAIMLVTHTRNVRLALGWLTTGTDNDTVDMEYLNSKNELNPSEYVELEYVDGTWTVEASSGAEGGGTQAS